MTRSSVTGLERRIARWILETRGDPRIRLVLWTGEEVRISDLPPVGRVVFRDRRLLFDLALHPDLGFPNAYADGRIEIEGDLPTFLKLALAETSDYGFTKRMRDAWELRRRRSKSLARAKDNIHRHYDL